MTMPYVQSRKNKARHAAQRWRGTYLKKGEWWDSVLGGVRTDRHAVYDKLVALGPDPNPDEVNAIIGNDSWTDVRCDQCGKDCETVVTIGQEADYESSTAGLCPSCLADCVKMLLENPT